MNIVDKIKADLIERLKRKTIYNDSGCWLYTGALTEGYGTIKILKRVYLVHRISASLYHNLNLDDSSIQANHTVNCVNKNCWNPEHLYVGTQWENGQDIRKAIQAGRKYKYHNQ